LPLVPGGRPQGLKIILVMAAITRIVWVLYAARSEPVFLVSGDQYSYWYYAQEIAAGRGYVSYTTDQPTAYYPIGFPALLAAVYWLVLSTPIPDTLPITTGVTQAALGTLTVWFVFLIGRAVWGHRVGIVAAALMAVFPSAIFGVATYSLEIAFVASCLGALAILLTHDWSVGPPSWARLIGFGAALAISVTIRPFSLPILIALAVGLVMIRTRWQRVLGSVAVVILVLVAAATPWTIRNAVQMNDFVPISTNLGDTMCMSRFPGSAGTFSWADHDWCADASLPETKRNRANIRMAVRFVLEHPEEEFALIGRRFIEMMRHDHWSLEEVESNAAGAWIPGNLRRILSSVADTTWFLILALALAGIGSSITGARRQPWFAMTTVVGISLLLIPLGLWGTPRFHAPVTPFIILFAAVAITQLIDILMRSRHQPTSSVIERDTAVSTLDTASHTTD